MSAIPKRILAVGIMAVAAIIGRGTEQAHGPPPEREASRDPAATRAFGPIQPRLSRAGDRVAFS